MTLDEHAGETLEGRYRLRRKLAEGGMGSIYLAEHATIGSKVAIKFLRSEFLSSEVLVERFHREAKAAAAVRHRNIVSVFDVGTSPWGEPYIVMEYLEGESLAQMLRRTGPLSLTNAVGIAEQVLEGLSAAHVAGIVHRDLKPENIFLAYDGHEEPAVKIIDFGISKFVRDTTETTLTRDGSVLGTAKYMSPEQARGQSDVTHLTDIYALGVILYRMLTGEVPYDGANYNETLAAVLTRPPRPLSDVCAGIPSEVEKVVMRALAREPKARFKDALEMQDALKGLGVSGACRRVEGAELSVATGDIGEADTHPDGAVTKAERKKPASGPHGDLVWKPDRPEGLWRRFRRFFRIAAIAACIAAVAFLALRYGPSIWPRGATRPPAAGTAKAPSAPSPASATQAADGVLIAVEDEPDGGLIYYDGALVPMNPFRAERKATIVPLRVEAKGYETFSVAVLPSRDQIVRVSMKKRSPAHRALPNVTNLFPAPHAQASGKGGPLTPQRQKVVNANRSELKRCYDQGLIEGKVPADRDLVINFKVSVDKTGVVRSVSLSGRGAVIPELNTCLENTVKTWVFPSSAHGDSIKFSFAFTTQT
ncbi:MAG: protein kinase [Deltaproteobacteria bacterium]|nr:protein kinase [Deltaproteobacteria bacterium]